MDWHKLLFAAIGLAIFIIASIIRASQSNQRRDPPRPMGNDPNARRRRTPEEIDEFLREVRRRREGQEGERPEPAPRPVTQQRPRPAPVVVREPRPAKVEEPILTVLPVRQDIASPSQVQRPEVHATIQPDKQPIGTVTKRPVSPAVMQLASLVRSRQSLRAAIMLREILDPPLCRRNHSNSFVSQSRDRIES